MDATLEVTGYYISEFFERELAQVMQFKKKKCTGL